MAARKQRRKAVPKTGRATWREGWSKRSGVTIVAPQGRAGWRLRWRDPDDDTSVKTQTIPKEDAGNAEARQAYAEQKAAELQGRRVDLDRGAPRKTRTGLEAAIQLYYDGHPRLRDKTVSAYRGATDKLLEWARQRGIRSADDLDLAALTAWRASVVKAPKTAAKTGKGNRGQRKQTKERRSEHSINRELRAARTVLGYLVDLGKLPKLSHDALRRGLKRLEVSHERLEYMRREEIATLLDACLQYDADRAKLRELELANIKKEGGGRKPRALEPIAPFVLTLLLGGFRLGEALELKWSDVDLEAPDVNGKAVGEIYLRGSETKTHKARTVGLDVSPALRELLRVLRPKGGSGQVFALQRAAAVQASKRLRANRGAPESFTYQALRRTCGTFLAGAPGLGVSVYAVAERCGHSVTVAQRHYYGAPKGISPRLKTLEAALGIEKHAARIIRAERERRKAVG